MESIGALIHSKKFKKVADLLPAPDEMETKYGTIEQTSVPAETVFYSIRRNENCAFKRKSPFRNGEESHKLFFFCKDISLCIDATDDDENLPVWEVSTTKKLKIIRIKEVRNNFLLPFWSGDDEMVFYELGYYNLEKILYYYLMKHNLDGYQAIVAIDQMGSEELPEFVFLEDVVEKEIVIQRCLPVREFLQQKRKRKRKALEDGKDKEKKRKLIF